MVKQQFLWVCATLTILILGISAEQDNSLGIYGVRWFLGEHFTYTVDDDSDNNEYFVLTFNTPKQIQGQISVKIGKNRFTCTSEFISTKNFTIHHQDDGNFTNNSGEDIVDQAYIHKCVIGNIRTITNSISIKTISYSIVLDSLYITQSVNPAIDKFSHKVLYNNTFRLPYYQSSFQALVIGDWGQIRQDGKKKGYVDPLPCILKKVKENENIVIVLFTGDLAYDLQGGKYYSMLKYMQPLTSQITFVAAPGNHDTLYHADTFELFTKSYYTPQFWSYSNYFNKFSIGRLLFIVYNPQLQQFDFKHPDRLKKNLTSIFETEFSDQVIKSIKSQYFPIVFSHYPIYCSDINDDQSSCQRNPDRFKAYRNYFNKLDMKLYLSGHLHVYERTAPICFNGSYTKSNSDQYNMSCPIYVVEGVGGSDIYLQMKDQYPQKQYSQSLVYNTGFGILTINTDNENSYPRSVSFQHISAPKCSVADHFKMTNTLLAETTNSTPSSGKYHYVWVMMIKGAIACLIVGAMIVISLYVRRRYWKSTSLVRSDKNIQKQNHVQMVEQNFDAPQSNKSEKIGTQ